MWLFGAWASGSCLPCDDSRRRGGMESERVYAQPHFFLLASICSELGFGSCSCLQTSN
jgi:hypothetical protein